MKRRNQRTLRTQVSIDGVGLHTGNTVTMCFCPAPVNSGILFQRVDLPGKPIIAANVKYVQDTSRSTKLGIGSHSVQTVEHVLAAIHAYQIDNICIQVSSGELPICDGSSQPFVEMIEEAGIEEQSDLASTFQLEKPVYVSLGSTHLIAIPSDHYHISYTLHFPKTPIIGSQYFTFDVNQENFKKELSTCRTFVLYEEIAALLEKGLIRGGNLENAVVIKDNAIISKEGLRFPDEMVRHKVLDLIGDLALTGFHFQAHVIAIRSGHQSNVALAKELVNQISSNTNTYVEIGTKISKPLHF